MPDQDLSWEILVSKVLCHFVAHFEFEMDEFSSCPSSEVDEFLMDEIFCWIHSLGLMCCSSCISVYILI